MKLAVMGTFESYFDKNRSRLDFVCTLSDCPMTKIMKYVYALIDLVIIKSTI